MLSPSEPQPEIELEKNGVLPQEAIWPRLVVEAKEAAERDPALVSLYSSILESPSLEEAMARRLAARLASAALPAGPLAAVLLEPLRADPSIAAAVCADLTAVVERDPASGRLLEPFLFFKGFASIEAHRLAHWFWMGGRRDMAYYLQSQASEVFQTDIHPAARFGKGIFLDHATGFVVGETAEIEDNVSILHGVTLGGSGIEKGRRHPRVRTGVLIGPAPKSLAASRSASSRRSRPARSSRNPFLRAARRWAFPRALSRVRGRPIRQRLWTRIWPAEPMSRSTT